MSSKFLSNIGKNRMIDALRERKEDPFSIKEGKFRFGQLKDSFYYTDWTEQSFLADSSNKEIVSRSFDFSRFKYFIFAGILLLSILALRSAWLQLIKNDYYSMLSENNRRRAEIIEPKRGIIYTSDFEPLVKNTANFVLYFRPIDLPKDELVRDNLLRQISHILEDEPVSKNDIFNTEESFINHDGLDVISDNATFYKLKETLSMVKRGSLESYQPLFVAADIDYEKAMLISLKLQGWPGVFLSTKIRREYLFPAVSSAENNKENSLAHILGYTGKINDEEIKSLGPDYSLIDYVGKMGLEYSYEKELKGIAGRKNFEVDALGRQKKIINEAFAVDGKNLQLFLNLKLQQKTEEIVSSYLRRSGLERASVIIINPNNGGIMALVSLPSYDNNLFARGISQEEYNLFLNNPDKPLFNRSVSGEFPSGSTIKPIFAVGALQEEIIDDKTSFPSSGGLRYGEWFFPDWKAGGHGITNVRKALAESVNTFFYYIGGGYQNFKGLGVEGLIKYAKLFGLGEKSGIDLPGERAGFVPTAEWKKETKNESWYIGDTYHFAIGQGDVLTTPLQVANFTAAIANGGTLYSPQIVSGFLGKDNQIIQEMPVQIIRSDFVDNDNIEIVREGMRQTVTQGSAQTLQSVPVAVAGKTGTAQWSSRKSPHAWFTGFAPYDNPELVITILIEEGVEGSTMAVPIARDILNWYFSDR
ncbi:MAG: penicillin-binding protein 2 [Patescibacteria group bacterium]